MKHLTIGSILLMFATGCVHQHGQYHHYIHHDNWYAGRRAYYAAMHAGHECNGEFPTYYIDPSKCSNVSKTHHKGHSR